MLENQHSRYGAITRMLPPTTGKVFFVIHADNTSDNHLLEEFPVDRDGVPRVYQTVDNAATDHLAIQAALDACVSGRNDYVIIMPGGGNDYDFAVKLTMSKHDVHLVSFEGLERDPDRVGASKQVVLDAYGLMTDDMIYITGTNCEVAGFYFKNPANYSCIQTGDVAHGANIHHNLMYMVVSTTMSVPIIDLLTTGGGIYSRVANNFLTSQSGTLAYGIAVKGNGTGTVVRKNYIMVGDGATVTKAIYNIAYKGITEYNTVAGLDGTGADGTVTIAIEVAGGVMNHNTCNEHASNDYTIDGTYMNSGNHMGGLDDDGLTTA